MCQKNKILENCKCTLISWTHGPNKVKNSKGVYHFDVNLARAFAFKFTKGKVKFIKGKCEIFVFCPFCLKISINFYFESHESNVPIDTVLLIPILLYILTFHVMSWMSQNVTKWPKMPGRGVQDLSTFLSYRYIICMYFQESQIMKYNLIHILGRGAGC